MTFWQATLGSRLSETWGPTVTVGQGDPSINASLLDPNSKWSKPRCTPCVPITNRSASEARSVLMISDGTVPSITTCSAPTPAAPTPATKSLSSSSAFLRSKLEMLSRTSTVWE